MQCRLEQPGRIESPKQWQINPACFLAALNAMAAFSTMTHFLFISGYIDERYQHQTGSAGSPLLQSPQPSLCGRLLRAPDRYSPERQRAHRCRGVLHQRRLGEDPLPQGAGSPWSAHPDQAQGHR